MSTLNDWQTAYASRPDAASESLVPATSLRVPATLVDLHLGTGTSIFSALAPLLLHHTKHELLLVTCFWAPSPSLTILNSLLRDLSHKALRLGHCIRVRLCFSSRTLLQKLFHCRSSRGYVYPQAELHDTLGLPPPHDIPNLDLQVKSAFIQPFSVMHPKFILVDRTTAILPSCNVSWEDWFEAALTIKLPPRNPLFHFWQSFWSYGAAFQVPDALHDEPPTSIADSADTVLNDTPDSPSLSPRKLPPPISPSTLSTTSASPLPLPITLDLSDSPDANILFLPHPHHSNPHFRPWPLPAPSPPSTPLNSCTLHLLANAEHSIWLLTPNLTAPPVLAALRDALRRGVAVSILSNDALMRTEQLLTAGTTTARCVRALQSWHRAAVRPATDPERAAPLGPLRVAYFTPSAADTRREAASRARRQVGLLRPRAAVAPVKTHVKMCVVDDAVALLGSGNQDRASWFTSQEVGFAVAGRVAGVWRGEVERALGGRLRDA